MWNPLFKMFSVVFVFSSGTAQCQLTNLNGKTYDAYYMSNGNHMIIDSTAASDTAKFKAELSITFPVNPGDSGGLRKGLIKYGAVHHDPNNCSIQPVIIITSDSIFITTMIEGLEIYDPCAGHTDFADEIWEFFEENVKTSYIKQGNNIEIIWDDGKKVICLRPRP
jgi:hypothetical protein